eukprot:3591798-Amphidinium_carterae.1
MGALGLVVDSASSLCCVCVSVVCLTMAVRVVAPLRFARSQFLGGRAFESHAADNHSTARSLKPLL